VFAEMTQEVAADVMARLREVARHIKPTDVVAACERRSVEQVNCAVRPWWGKVCRARSSEWRSSGSDQ